MGFGARNRGFVAMNGADVLRIVDMMHREKNIPKDIIFGSIEAAVQLATQKHYGEEEGIVVTIDRDSGAIVAKRNDDLIEPEVLGRIAAQSAKQLMIQKIREAESDALFGEFANQKGDLVVATVQRFESGAATCTLGKS